MIRVLVVDDDYMVAQIHGEYVAQTGGFTVAGTAHSGTAALHLVRSLRPDLVLLDLYLPDLHGLAVLKRLREEPDLPAVDVVVITAAHDVSTVRKAMRGGAVHYLVKPFTYPALRERLEHYAAVHQRLTTAATAQQADIDVIFGPLGRSQRLPKGLAPETAALIERVLRTATGDLSASECALAAGLARVSARRYLEHFTDCGRVEVSLRYGTNGRPERRYRWRGS